MCLFAYWTSSSNMSTKWNIHGKTVPPLVSLASWLEIIPLCALVCVCVHLCRNYSSPTKMVEKKITHGLKQCKTMIYIPNKYLSKINGSPPFFFGFFSTLSTCSPCSSTTNILFNSYKCRECRRIMNMNIQEVQAESARENVFISLQISSSSRCCWAQLFSHFACISLDFVKWIYAKIITWHWPISGKKLSYVSTEKRQNRMVIRNYEHISCFFFDWTEIASTSYLAWVYKKKPTIRFDSFIVMILFAICGIPKYWHYSTITKRARKNAKS